MIPTPLSGRQINLRLDEQHLVVTDVGAHVREYTVGPRAVFEPFGADVVPPAFHGAVLAPWPSRVRDGRYTFGGREHQLPITDVRGRTALHGLVHQHRWVLRERTASAATLALRLPASTGYPFDVELVVTYGLTEQGLEVRFTAHNHGTETAPYGVGFHPWLATGGGDLDDCTLRVDAASRVVSDERLLPVGTEPVRGDLDLREPRSLRGLDLDGAWVDVARDQDGRSWAELHCPDGRTVALWMDRTLEAWQVCTGDHVPSVRRAAVAVEPMTCVADAFNTGDRLVHLAPGSTHEVAWGAQLR